MPAHVRLCSLVQYQLPSLAFVDELLEGRLDKMKFRSLSSCSIPLLVLATLVGAKSFAHPTVLATIIDELLGGNATEFPRDQRGISHLQQRRYFAIGIIFVLFLGLHALATPYSILGSPKSFIATAHPVQHGTAISLVQKLPEAVN